MDKLRGRAREPEKGEQPGQCQTGHRGTDSSRAGTAAGLGGCRGADLPGDGWAWRAAAGSRDHMGSGKWEEAGAGSEIAR